MQLQKFGIEVRRIGTNKGLYKEIDIVLNKYNIKPNSVSVDAQVLTIAHAIQKMLETSSHFSVCCVRDCAAIAQIVIPDERMRIYQAAHCINWSSMIPEYRQIITAMVLDDFRTVLNPE